MKFRLSLTGVLILNKEIKVNDTNNNFKIALFLQYSPLSYLEILTISVKKDFYNYFCNSLSKITIYVCI